MPLPGDLAVVAGQRRLRPLITDGRQEAWVGCGAGAGAATMRLAPPTHCEESLR